MLLKLNSLILTDGRCLPTSCWYWCWFCCCPVVNALHRPHISSSLMRRVTRHNNVGGLSEAKTLWPLDSLPPTSFLGGRWSLKKYTSNNNYDWCVRPVHGNVFPSLSYECQEKSMIVFIRKWSIVCSLLELLYAQWLTYGNFFPQQEAHGDWLAIAHGDPVCQALSSRFGVRGIPALKVSWNGDSWFIKFINWSWSRSHDHGYDGLLVIYVSIHKIMSSWNISWPLPMDRESSGNHGTMIKLLVL